MAEIARADMSGGAEQPAIDAQCFPPADGLDVAALHASLGEKLDAFRRRAVDDPFGSPILRMAIEVNALVDREELSMGGLEALIRHMTARAFGNRAQRLADFVGDLAVEANQVAVRAVIERVARPDAGGEPVPYHQFRTAMEAWHYGVVFTAHPTFSNSRGVARTLATGAACGERTSHRPDPTLTLDDEFAWAGEAIAHAQEALSRAHAIAIDVARRYYPQDWRSLVPRLISIASWVGYDHDGRSDIGWADTLRMRLRAKLAQLRRIRDLCARLRADNSRSQAAAALGRAEARLMRAVREVERQITASDGAGGDAHDRAAAFARKLVEGGDAALTRVDPVVALMTEAVDLAETPELAAEISVARAALASHGLSNAHCHFRLNAAQIHNAVRRQIGLAAESGDPNDRRTHMNAIGALLDTVEPSTVNLGVLMAERASARRMFMMIAQLAKHIDAETPVRFLIAETETSFTLLAALYLARLFGVDHLVEISPLFETEEALEHGHRVVDGALRSAQFRSYVQRMGRLTLQFGFSDSGRYVGQMAATYGIERLRAKIAEVLQKHGLRDVRIVLFNTHGDSIGRGGHPGGMPDRLRYVAPPVSRRAFRAAGIDVKEESSFQGGDGYLLFMSPALAFASLRHVMEFALASDPEEEGDPVYDDAEFATEFFGEIRREFSGLVGDPGYAALLGALGVSLLDRTGSRPVKRQMETMVAAAEYPHPSQMRAIPNNGVLQQLGLLANTVTGVGRAVSRNPQKFRRLMRRSPRFRRAMGMVQYAMSLSDLDVVRAYIDTLDPGLWLGRSERATSDARRAELRIVAHQLERHDVHARLVRMFRRAQDDHLHLRERMIEAAEDDALPGIKLGPEARDDLLLLHALRIALIHRIYLLASHIPDFTPQAGFTRDDVFQALLRLEIEQAAPLLREVFPRRDASGEAELDFGEPASYRDGARDTYEAEHQRIIEPIVANFDLVRRISAAVTHLVGAVG